jgi:putative transposase
MNPPKCDELDYIQFLVAAQKAFTATEAARSQPESRQKPPAHDAFTRLLTRKPPDTEALWREAEALVKVGLGLLVHDDTTLDKPYARKMELVRRHWSGKHKKRVVSGINLSTLLWTDGHALVPTDFRVYDKPQDGLTKNEHFRRMLARAEARGFRPRYVLFDSWYSALKNLKAIRDYGWQWLTRLKSNRLVNPEKKGNLPVREVPIPTEGRVVHLKGYGMVKVFRTVAKDGDAEYWATNDLGMSEEGRRELKRQGWGIESYHRGIKQCCGVERSQEARGGRAQRNHLEFALRAFLRLEAYRVRTGISWYEAKSAVIREAVRAYLTQPLYCLKPSA